MPTDQLSKEPLARLRGLLADYRAAAAALHAKLVMLERAGNDLAPLRRTLLESTARIEAAWKLEPPPRAARGTEPLTTSACAGPSSARSAP